MKRCPQCYELHDDGERFCETDGHELLADPTCSPEAEVPVRVPRAKGHWWPAATFGVLIGLLVGAGIFIPVSLMLRTQSPEPQATRPAADAGEKALPNRMSASSHSIPTSLPEESPSPESDEQAEATPSPAPNADDKTVAVQLNQGPISTGQKTKPSESESSAQTVIEMTDGSTLNVDAAWEDKQGIWYRRSGLVSFVESSRVKAISARKGTKPAEVQDR